jgi:hypothetical protein
MTDRDRERIRRAVAAAPKLTPEQLARLRELLPPVEPKAAAA